MQHRAGIAVSTAPMQELHFTHRHPRRRVGEGGTGAAGSGAALVWTRTYRCGPRRGSASTTPPQALGLSTLISPCDAHSVQQPVNIFTYDFTSPVCGIRQSSLWYFSECLGCGLATGRLGALPRQQGPPFLAADGVKFLRWNEPFLTICPGTRRSNFATALKPWTLETYEKSPENKCTERSLLCPGGACRAHPCLAHLSPAAPPCPHHACCLPHTVPTPCMLPAPRTPIPGVQVSLWPCVPTFPAARPGCRPCGAGMSRAHEGSEGPAAAQAAAFPSGQAGAGMCFPISGILLIIIATINTKGILAVFLSAQPLCL